MNHESFILDDEKSWHLHISGNQVAAAPIINDAKIDREAVKTLMINGFDAVGWCESNPTERRTIRQVFHNRMEKISDIFMQHIISACKFADEAVGRANWCYMMVRAIGEYRMFIYYRATGLKIADAVLTFTVDDEPSTDSYITYMPRYHYSVADVVGALRDHPKLGIYHACWDYTGGSGTRSDRLKAWEAFLKWEAKVKETWPQYTEKATKLYEELDRVRAERDAFVEAQTKKLEKYAKIFGAYV